MARWCLRTKTCDFANRTIGNAGMSKAFTRESEDLPDIPLPRQTPTLPPGAKNYLTPKGARELREELDRLIEQERPRQAESQESNQTGRELQLRQRIAHLQQSLQSAVIVEPPPPPWD